MSEPHPHEPEPATPPEAKPPVPLRDKLAWSLDEISELTGVSRRSLERLKSAGKLPPPIKIGRRVAWSAEAIRRWIEGGGA